ncbi:hypothetical protein LTR70_009610 [Exophiala xenobiotica]|uniref:Glomerulosclerosis protein Mpv17 n=1 Tax=Lithohypha guttulata TaxID=1690604 RepID=A0ABR0JX60_9EURO|nr:hypothetical protein LTR24_009512 [Lithohypha guttulata]KAK5310270.1 hypothetical protein LTR70_009610 [Exophiala xenobiotica]
MSALQYAQQATGLIRTAARLPLSGMRRPIQRRPFHRNVMTKEQIKTAEMQKTPHTPNQIVTEVPHSKEPSMVFDVPSPLWYHRLGPVKDFFGALASIPGYKWFMFLGSHFNYGSTITTIAIKVAIQQFFFAPIFNTYFFGMQAILSGASPSAVIERVKGAVPESVISSAKFWPAVTALNFTVIPAHMRFAFSAIFAVMWQSYLSFLNRKEERIEPMGTMVEEAKVRVEEYVDVVTGDD